LIWAGLKEGTQERSHFISFRVCLAEPQSPDMAKTPAPQSSGGIQ
jgi:hypothetical protein